MAFCLGRPGLNPGWDFGFFQFRIAVNQFSLGVRLFLSYFLSSFTIVKIINFKLAIFQEKGKINSKLVGKAHIKKQKKHKVSPIGQKSHLTS